MMYKFICIIAATIFALSDVSAQSVSFGHSGAHIPRKLIKQEKKRKKTIKADFDKLKSNINDATYVNGAKAEIKRITDMAKMPVDVNKIKVGDKSSVDVVYKQIKK